jgi:hypothetical protein
LGFLTIQREDEDHDIGVTSRSRLTTTQFSVMIKTAHACLHIQQKTTIVSELWNGDGLSHIDRAKKLHYQPKQVFTTFHMVIVGN